MSNYKLHWSLLSTLSMSTTWHIVIRILQELHALVVMDGYWKHSTPGESHRIFRMNEMLFVQLHDLLVSDYGLKSSIHMSSLESLAIFLCICGQNRSNTSVQNTFKHSGETVSRKFDDVLRCLIKMSKDYIRPQDCNFTIVHKRIRGDQRMWPHFKGCT
jgi:hypothetical protein